MTGFRVSKISGGPPAGGAYFMARPRATSVGPIFGSTVRATSVIAEAGGAGW